MEKLTNDLLMTGIKIVADPVKAMPVTVGTEYHWYILAHQMVVKLDANSYKHLLKFLKEFHHSLGKRARSI